MPKSNARIFFLIAFILCLSYSNTFHASWHLDDDSNIINNSKLHISELNFKQLNNAIRANPSDHASLNNNNLYRPIPCLTFGLNWYFGQDMVFGYHVVNILIHIVTAWFLFLSLRLLLQINYNQKYPPQFFTAAALLGALFWALAPIQTQAVTYIVQRMASMAAMFSIIAIYAYILGRIETKKKYYWFAISFLFLVAALGSKENTILLLPSLLLLEIVFFQHDLAVKKIFIFSVVTAISVILSLFFIYYVLGLAPFNLSNPLSFLDSYSHRSFTFKERILTEPRIVLMYLSQILFPVAGRLSLEHDIVLSTSLYSPWTTFFAILLISLLIFCSFFYIKKYPLFSFSILFFFLNHTVESTILQLELVFEHRNYLPSFFIFLPLAFFVAHVLYVSPQQPVFRRIIVASCAVLFIVISGHATYTRNLDWESEKTLWTAAFQKLPSSSRAAYHLGKWYYYAGQYNKAIYYIQLALENADETPTPEYSKYLALNGLALNNFAIGRYEQAITYLNKCLDIGEYAECLQNRSVVYAEKKLYKQALADADRLATAIPDYAYQLNAAIIAFESGDMRAAHSYLKRIIHLSFNDPKAIQLIGHVLMVEEKAYPNSLFFLKQANRLSPNDIDSQLALAAAYYLDNQPTLTETVLNDIFNKHPLPLIINALKNIKQNKIDSNAVGFIENNFDSMVKKSSVRHEP